MVASSGGPDRPVSGSRRTPRAARTCGGASATHSPAAANDRAPASTAATAASNNGRQRVPHTAPITRIRYPRQLLQQARALAGQYRAVTARQIRKLLQQARALAGQYRAVTARQIRKLLQGRTDRGMMTRQARSSAVDHGIRHPHDLGVVPVLLPERRNGDQGINRTSRHNPGALPPHPPRRRRNRPRSPLQDAQPSISRVRLKRPMVISKVGSLMIETSRSGSLGQTARTCLVPRLSRHEVLTCQKVATQSRGAAAMLGRRPR